MSKLDETFMGECPFNLDDEITIWKFLLNTSQKIQDIIATKLIDAIKPVIPDIRFYGVIEDMHIIVFHSDELGERPDEQEFSPGDIDGVKSLFKTICEVYPELFELIDEDNRIPLMPDQQEEIKKNLRRLKERGVNE
jgi:hypothetical protein